MDEDTPIPISEEEREEVLTEAQAGDYDNLLATCMRWVTVR